MADHVEALERLDAITRRLRVECPWDREQDARSIVPHTVEEAYELADAAGRDDAEAMVDELGDVLFQVLFLSLLLEERDLGDLGAVAESCAAKLVRRHPHVFGEPGGASSAARPGAEPGGASSAARPGAPGGEVTTSGEVLDQWERIKTDLEGRVRQGPLDDIPGNLPALIYARKVQRRLDPGGRAAEEPPRGDRRDAAEREVGELLWSAVARARELGVDPELALRAAVGRAGPVSSVAAKGATGMPRR